MLAIYYGGYGRGMVGDTRLYILLLVMIVVSMIASSRVNSNFRKFSKEAIQNGLTGRDVAKLILDRNGLYDVSIQPVGGVLTDHYDPRTKTVRLSEGVYDKSTVAAVSVAAHEVGHAIQHKEDYFFLKIRSSLAPVVQFSSSFVMILILVGFVLQIGGLVDVGIVLYSLSVLFHIITLPVEFDASRRAFDEMEINHVLAADEVKGSKKVLNAAAMTYVASMLVSLIQLLRFMSMRRK